MSSAKSFRALWVGLAFALACNLSVASPTAYSGTFLTDDELFSLPLAVTVDGVVTVTSLGYAGGVGSQGDVVSAGGFATQLSLFDVATGYLVALALPGDMPLHGSCTAAPTDPNTGYAWDACLSANLVIGNYLLVLSQSGNYANGGIADGFSQDGQPQYTSQIYGTGDPGMFVDLGGAQRNGNWALDVSQPAADIDNSVPEPSSVALLAAGLFGWRISRSRLLS